MLNWWWSSGVELMWSSYHMDYQSACSAIDVLDWRKASGLKLCYSSDAIARVKSPVTGGFQLVWSIDSSARISFSDSARGARIDFSRACCCSILTTWFSPEGVFAIRQVEGCMHQRSRR
ncbi:hypothetical protein BJ742DRAFT_286019 [Cladochytrium replicatum]|nr:hypothetical protein BJ742DRAFT_286019 [Cladochytrium replicatum]